MNLCSYKQNYYFMVKSSLFGAANLTKNADSDKYNYFVNGIGFEARGSF